MKRGLVLVEGQTEERVIEELLAPHFVALGLALIPRIVTTKCVAGGRDHRGGVVSYRQVERDLRLLLRDSHASVITTLFDYYALPVDFPGMKDRSAGDPSTRAAHVEAAWSVAVGDRRFLPNLAVHEVEAWLFADPSRLESWMFDDDAKAVPAIAEIAAVHATPEHIDDGRETAPSKRLSKVFAAYHKVLHGPLAIAAIGIDRIRDTCPHFARWLTGLEAVASSEVG